jgi:hypothetical protein
MKTSNSSIARKGDSDRSCSAKAKATVEKDRSPPVREQGMERS